MTPKHIAAIAAFAKVEGAGAGFAADGRAIVRFAPHWFQRPTFGRFNKSHSRLSHSYGMRWNCSQPGSRVRRWGEQLVPAFSLDRDTAVRSTSWGMFQMIGFNYRKCGFDSPQAFLNAHWNSPGGQLLGTGRCIRSSGLGDERQRRDWHADA